MAAIVVYRSKTGFTKTYAEWIAQELSAELVEASKVTPEMLAGFDTVVYGGGLYAGGIPGVKLIKGALPKLQGKTVVVFASGASPARPGVVTEVRDRNFTPEQQEQLHFFYMRGGFDFAKLGVLDKILMTALKWRLLLKKPKHMTADERGMLSAYSRSVDFRQRKNIAPLVSYVRRQNQK